VKKHDLPGRFQALPAPINTPVRLGDPTFLASRTFRTFGDKSREGTENLRILLRVPRAPEAGRRRDQPASSLGLSKSRDFKTRGTLEAARECSHGRIYICVAATCSPKTANRRETERARYGAIAFACFAELRNNSRGTRGEGGGEGASVAIANPANSGRVLRVPSASRRYKATGERRGESSGAFPFQIR